MSLLLASLTTGLILSLLAVGVFISFKIFNFADITAEGSITLGASISAIMIVGGINPFLSMIAALAAGFTAGAITGILHTKFKINRLLSGILVMTSIYSINLHIMGKSNVPLIDAKTFGSYIENFSSNFFGNGAVFKFFSWAVPYKDFSIFLFVFFIIVIAALKIHLFFKTDFGTAMRAAGSNPQMIKALGVDTDLMLILGLAMANGLIALAGAIFAQYQGFTDVQMGIGMMVIGLASIIIGESLILEKSFGFMIAGAVAGSVLFRLIIAIALRAGMNPNDLKLVTAVFVFIALVLPDMVKKLKRAE